MLVIGENRGEKKKKSSSMYPSIGLGSQQVQPLDEGERIDVQGRNQFTSFFELGNALDKF